MMISEDELIEKLAILVNCRNCDDFKYNNYVLAQLRLGFEIFDIHMVNELDLYKLDGANLDNRKNKIIKFIKEQKLKHQKNKKNSNKMKKEEFLTYLKKYSSNNTEILLKRDSIIDDISNGKIPTCCIANWIETVKLCNNNVYELDKENQLKQCEKCWKRFLK